MLHQSKDVSRPLPAGYLPVIFPAYYLYQMTSGSDPVKSCALKPEIKKGHLIYVYGILEPQELPL